MGAIDKEEVGRTSKVILESPKPATIEHEDGPLGILLAGLTRSFLLVAKNLPKGIIKAALKKRAFLTIGKRTASSGAVQSPRDVGLGKSSGSNAAGTMYET